jgi:hypothetical protein
LYGTSWWSIYFNILHIKNKKFGTLYSDIPILEEEVYANSPLWCFWFLLKMFCIKNNYLGNKLN